MITGSSIIIAIHANTIGDGVMVALGLMVSSQNNRSPLRLGTSPGMSTYLFVLITSWHTSKRVTL